MGRNEKAYTVALADEEIIIRQALKGFIEGIAGFRVVGEAEDSLKLLELLKKTLPDLIIIDIFLPNFSEEGVLEEIKQISPASKILILTKSKSMALAKSALTSGVHGYLLKGHSFAELLKAIKTIQRGDFYLSPTLPGDLLAGKKHSSLLTPQEIIVLKLFAEGHPRKEIARILHLSHSTVISHVLHIKQKLKIDSDINLVKYALQEEMISL
jgi:DNA-binding NarL/FixJ family response regulator